MKLFTIFATLWLGLASLLPAAAVAERSPVFGGAAIEALSQDAARTITARGDVANYYGGHAVSYAYIAYIYAYYARYFAPPNSLQEQTWYGVAAWYAYHAYLFSAWAQAYSQMGM